MKLDEIFSRVLDLPPSEIIGKKVDLTYKAGNYLGLCPFHNDSRLGSFVVTDSKGMWKCFACASGITGGNAITFRQRYDGKTYFEAAMTIAVEEGIISDNEYADIMHRKISKSEINAIKKVSSNKKIQKKPELDYNLMHDVYQAMHDVCGLKSDHRRHLEEVRHLPDERIQRDYFTFPNSGKDQVMQYIMHHLESQGKTFQKEDLEKVPGFFYDRKKKTVTFAGYSGIGILLRNASGRIVGIQIRRDKIRDGESRYIWFSSSFAQRDAALYRGGSSVGSPVDVVYPQTVTGKKLFLGIAEGRFKTEQLAAHGDFIGISVQGVGNYKGIEKEIEYILKQALAKKWVSKTLIIFYDADMLHNFQVLKHAITLNKYLHKKLKEMDPNLCVNVKFALWHEELGKGIDDLIINENESDIHYLDAEEVETVFHAILAAFLNKYGIEKEASIPDDKKEAFCLEIEEALKKVFF